MNLLRSLAAVSSMTMISRILGLVREMIISHTFGAGTATDVFFTAFKLPNLLRRIFAEGAFSQAFVPILAEHKTRQGEEATREFIAKIAGALTLALVIITAIGILAAPAVIYLSAAGFSHDPAKFALATDLLRWIFPYILLISLASFVGSILNTWNKFSIPAFVPTLLNLSFIVCAIFLAPHLQQPIYALAAAVIIGGVIQLAFQLPWLARCGMLVRPRLDLRDSGVRQVMTNMLPALFAVSVAQISILINSNLASFLESGSISWIFYADRLMEFPVGVLGVALGTILLPSLSKSVANDDPDEYSRLLDWGLRLCLLLCVPATIGLGLLAGPLILTVFQSGKFTVHDAAMTQQALLGYSIGLMGMILVKILAPGFYARKDIRTPVRIACMALASTLALNILFITLLPFKHAGLTLGIALGQCLNAWLLYRGLRVKNLYQPQAKWGAFLLKLALASICMATTLVLLQKILPDFTIMSRWWRAGGLTALVSTGAIVYLGSLFLLGFKLKDFRRTTR
ncbi:murein biosynthesis integral membrane protein MurJ [Chitinilyticum piscinae]|uniref:Probable lipid II flippase MurJ n=1 Tax=Chitinilyticum piscinae TaxID=2866724 RepID=A0A8J7FIR5_9NEIS|nr:murein biosynthesis integral membrane protein MurJ [Chitinilyticum piscinae]MBE9608925.1 murein biosynthesis integral membrane protein MurJ [Chitinilyticum piscinae]